MSQISLPFPWDWVTPSSLLSRWVYAAFTVSVVFQEEGLLHTCVKPAPSNQKPAQNDLTGDSSPQLISKHTTPTLGGAAASRTHVHGPPLPQGLRTDPSPCLGPSPLSHARSVPSRPSALLPGMTPACRRLRHTGVGSAASSVVGFMSVFPT